MSNFVYGSTGLHGQGNDVIVNNEGQLRVTQHDLSGRALEFDNLFKAALVMQTEHHEVHEGNHYSICAVGVFSLNDTVEYVITTPDTAEWAHMLFLVNTTAGFRLDVYEGSSSVVDGTPVVPNNNNRNSLNTSGLVILQDPTSITDGDLRVSLGGGNNQKGGITDRANELILKQNEVYLFRITSLNNNNTMAYCADWYEHIGA